MLKPASLTRATLGRRARAGLGALLLASLGLVSCGGSNGGEDDSGAVIDAGSSASDAAAVVRNPRRGFARLGALKGATVEVFDLHSDTPIFRTTTDGDGGFAIDLGSHPAGEFYKVQISGGTDVNFDDKGTAGQAPVPNSGTLSAIATGTQIVERGVSVTLLSDLLARHVDDGILWNHQALVQRELDEAAGHLFSHDIDGDGVIDYHDVLAFNPQNADHKGWLKVDWNVFFIKNSQGLSVMDMMHANHPALSDELMAAMGNAIDINLLDADIAPLASLTFGVDGHGSLSTDAIPVQLDHDNSRYAKAFDRSSAKAIVVRATPSSGSRLLAWEGCTADVSDPLLCRVAPDSSKPVLAIFQDPDRAKANTTAIHLASSTSAVGFVLRESNAVITAVRTDPLVARLDAALAVIAANPQHELYVGGDVAKEATVRVKSLLSRVEIEGVVRYVVTYASALVTDALESGSAYAPPAAISVETISRLSYTGADDKSTTVQPGNQANADFIAGPNPIDPAIDARLCGATKSQHVLVDDSVACIAGSNLPVQTMTGLAHACDAGQTLVETLDGEEFCVAPSDIHTRAEVRTLSASLGNRPLSFDRAQTGAMSVKALQQPVQTSLAPLALKPGQVLWLVGHGKAIYMSRNVFMIDRPDGQGVRMVTVDGAITSLTEESRAPMAYQQCSRDTAAPECGFFKAGQGARMRALSAGSTAQADLIPPIEFTVSPVKYPWISFKFKLNVELTGNASASFDWGVLWYAFNSRGKIEVAPVFNTTITATGTPQFKKPTPTSPVTEREAISAASTIQSGEPVFEKDIFKIDFLQKIPGTSSVSPVLESALRFAIGADASGQATIEIETSYRHVVAWDVKSEFTYYVFKSNYNNQSFKVVNRGYPGVSIKVDANASMGLYAKAVVSMGPRGLMPELASLQARFYLYKLEAMGQMFLSYQTDPVKVAAQSGQNFCWAGGISMTLKRSFDVTAKIDLSPTSGSLRDILGYLSLPRWEWTLYSWDGILLNVGTSRGAIVPEAVLGADLNVLGVSNVGADKVLTSGYKLECPKPSPASMPAERSYPAQSFKLESGHSIYTKTHEYTVQTDGNFVIFNWNGQRQGVAWASGTNDQAAVAGYNQMYMGADGHLILKDMLDNGLFHTWVYGVGANVVKLGSTGALEIWSTNAKLWSSAIGLVRDLPASATYLPGTLTLNSGEAVTAINRSFTLDTTGRLYLLRMVDNRNGGTAWNNGVSAGSRARMVFQPNGNLEVFNNAGALAWQSGTANKGVTRLVVEGNGRLAIFAGNTLLWATGS